MLDLAVVGGGFWGVAVAHEARHRGATVTLYDDAQPRGASRNAAGMVCESWYRQATVRKMLPSWWKPQHVGLGLAWLKAHAGLRHSGELFASYQSWDGTWRERPDCWVLPDCTALLALVPPQVQAVHSLQRNGDGWQLVDSRAQTLAYARRVVVAAGAWTDHLLAHSGLGTTGVTVLVGRALFASPGQALLALPHTFLAQPYRHYTVRPWSDGTLRCGDTVERSHSLRQQEQAVAALERAAPSSAVCRWVEGWRPVLPTMVVELWRPGLVVATGGHRVGLGMAWGVAQRALETLAL